MLELARGSLEKMQTQLADPIEYQLVLGEQRIQLSPYLGKHLKLEYLSSILCCHCGHKTKTSFGQGYCWNCFQTLAQCDSCMMAPERCHYEQGTCREPSWAEQFCMSDHIVYLANSSALKVGITRATQIPTRWIDQGATQGLPIFRVATRQQSGLIEDALREHVSDRTNWRAMLKNDAKQLDMAAQRDQLLSRCEASIYQLQQRFGLQAIQPFEQRESLFLQYPVLEYPVKISSFNLDKNPIVEGILLGIKGQYLIFDTGVINIRKYTAYQMVLSVNDTTLF
ncbi:DUF2797 domain-containing protein [Pseudomonas sp. F1_0610]|uniref:DUF2797 domain-containing protein n=1 Tax=Pseudomonas sp. F1_0610 TaxID=3114284 RepID=UPI0039C0F73B